MFSFAVAIAVVVLLYAAFIGALLLAGRREAAAALARFVPDCIVLVKRLLTDPRVSRRHKLLLGAVAAYLACPIDIVPDFIPVAGQLDDAIVLAYALRRILVGAGPELMHEHWPGPPRSLAPILRLAER